MNMAEDIIPPEVQARLLRHFASLSFGFWAGPTRHKATLFALGLFAGLLLNLAPAIAVNRWNKFFFDALQNKDERLILLSIGLMLALALASALTSVALLQAAHGLPVGSSAFTTARSTSRRDPSRESDEPLIVDGRYHPTRRRTYAKRRATKKGGG